jgi:hypothetical protein
LVCLAGHKQKYSVVQWSYEWDPSLFDLLDRMPELVLGRHVVVVSWDSGQYKPTQAELDCGWEVVNGVAVSPKIAVVSDLLTAGFDEWYVYEERPRPYGYLASVNRFGFAPLPPDQAPEFWTQVEDALPLHVLGAGTPTMFLATRDRKSFDRALSLGDL